jgi:hypothetical protein
VAGVWYGAEAARLAWPLTAACVENAQSKGNQHKSKLADMGGHHGEAHRGVSRADRRPLCDCRWGRISALDGIKASERRKPPG